MIILNERRAGRSRWPAVWRNRRSSIIYYYVQYAYAGLEPNNYNILLYCVHR